MFAHSGCSSAVLRAVPPLRLSPRGFGSFYLCRPMLTLRGSYHYRPPLEVIHFRPVACKRSGLANRRRRAPAAAALMDETHTVSLGR